MTSRTLPSPASTLVVIAKAPVPGRAKTRLTPPFTPAQAAVLAEAALTETLESAVASGADRVVLALDADPGGWLPEGIEVIAQRGAGLAQRLAAALADTAGPAFLVGMDTPQLTLDQLRAGLASPCALGLCTDGGWWGLSLPAPDHRVFTGIPMSRADTGERQRSRLLGLGYQPLLLPVLRDVDTFADARAVAASAPGTRFAAAMRSLAPRPGLIGV